MDVRCESCHTEYELDDGSVSESGTDVQCTFCGHTFTVFRRASAAPAAGPGEAGGDFALETADGRVHRLRDLTVLQKWIIERRVTRSDRLSRGGQAWTRLGSLEDLAPFFDVVDEADRARAAVARPSSPDIAAVRAQRAATPGGAPVAAGGTVLGHSSPSLPIMPTVSPRSGPGGERATNRSLELMAVEAPFGSTDPETSLIRRPASRGRWKLLVTFGVAGGVAYGGMRALPDMMTPRGDQATADPASTPGAATTAPTTAAAPQGIPAASDPPAPGAQPDPAGGSAAIVATGGGTTTQPMEATPPASAPAGDPTTGSGPAGSTAAPAGSAAVVPAVAQTVEPASPPPPSAAAKPIDRAAPPEKPVARPRPPAAPAGPAEPASYEQMVAQADKLLGNGANERALKIYERALRLKPGAPDALTGIGYAHLDRGRTGPAIDYFTRASAGSAHPPALFGLGQAYRAAGDINRARETYRRYLSLFPGGPEASTAERQLRSMPSAAESGAAGGPSNPGSGTEVSTPASILQEGGQDNAKAREGGGGSAPANPPRPFDAPAP